MNTAKSSSSNATSYQEIGDYWDTHDLAEHWEKTKPVDFEIDIGSRRKYYAIDSGMSKKISDLARFHGISAETLVNLWIQEKLREHEEA